MKKYFLNIVSTAMIFLAASCSRSDHNDPGREYMPDMYRSPSYETYSSNPNFADSMSSRQPVAGTVARGDEIFTDYDRLSYPYPDTPEGYEEAGAKLRNPIEKNEANMAEGKRLYENYCTHCHGATGMGDGLVVQFNGPPPPAYNSAQLKNLPEGKMYHTIQWGKNMMGSHASQLTPTQRWKVVQYIQTMQAPSSQAAAETDSAKTAEPKKM